MREPVIEQSVGLSIKRAVLWALIGLGLPGLGFLAAVIVLSLNPPHKPDTVAQPATPALRVSPTLTVPTAPVKVYDHKVKKKLKLPPTKETEQVIAATRVQESPRPQTVTTVLDTATGETRSFVKAEPYPWFAVEPRGEVRLMVGAKLEGTRVREAVRLGATYDVIRVKALTVGVSGTLDSDGDAFVGVGVSYRW